MIIHGSQINPAALSEVKSLADLKRLNIFQHLPNKDEANADLWDKIKPKTGSKSKMPDEPKQTQEPE